MAWVWAAPRADEAVGSKKKRPLMDGRFSRSRPPRRRGSPFLRPRGKPKPDRPRQKTELCACGKNQINLKKKTEPHLKRDSMKLNPKVKGAAAVVVRGNAK